MLFRLTKKIWLITTLVAPVLSFASEKESEAKITIEVLDAFCIQNQNDFSQIIPIAKSTAVLLTRRLLLTVTKK